jgi:prepilin-type processing-associated H-X9-DG protein
MRTHRAFTVIELCIVLAVMMVLVGILIPAVSRIRRASMAAACLSNLRSLEQAHWAYLTDHEGRFIDAGLPHDSLPDEEAAWIHTLKSYYTNPGTLKSPADRSPHWPVDGVPVPGTTDRYRQTSYGCNNYLTQYSPQEAIEGAGTGANRLSRVPDPANTVHFLIMVFTDENGFCGSDHVHVESWWNQQAGDNSQPQIVATDHTQTNTHGGPEKSWDSRSNYAFLDGHVETAPFSRVYLNRDTHNRFDPAVSRFWAARLAKAQ